MQYLALCHTCRHQHKIEFDPKKGPGNQLSDWYVKHPGPEHITEFRFPQRRQREMKSRPRRLWTDYIHNANVNVSYAASAAPTLTLASLAASSGLLSGRESTLVDNSSNLYLDYLAAGQYKANSANNQAGTIYTCIVAPRDDGGGTAVWPDVFDGTDSTETVTSSGIFNSVCKILSSINADATASRVWPWGMASIASLYGGAMPFKFVYFITHNIQTSTNVWSATEGDHAVKHTGVYATVA